MNHTVVDHILNHSQKILFTIYYELNVYNFELNTYLIYYNFNIAFSYIGIRVSIQLLVLCSYYIIYILLCTIIFIEQFYLNYYLYS